MQSFSNFWNSGTTGKVVIISASVLLLVCGCCVALYALGLALPAAPATPTLMVPPTNPISFTATLDQPTVAPSNTLVSTATPTATDTVTATSTPTETPSATATTAPQPTSPPAPNFTVVQLTSPVAAGGVATLQIQGPPSANCFLSYTTPSGNPSTADGLGSKTAGADGICLWTWKISPGTSPGTGRLHITVNDVTETKDIIIQ